MVLKGSFDDYLYILIGIVWVAVSIYKGVQKRKQATTPVQNENREEKKSFFNQIFEEFVEKNEFDVKDTKRREFEQVSPPKFAAVKDENKEDVIFSYDDVYEESNVNEYDAVYKKEQLKKSPPKVQVKAPRSRRKRSFDIRKAVIFSEILRRPYL